MLLRLAVVLQLLLCLPGLVVAGSIAATKHNLSSSAPAGNSVFSTSENQICVFCHIPHNANSSTVLWNHETSNAAYTMYGSTADAESKWTLEYLPSEIPNRPTGSSRLCLSCHDGTIAVGSYNGAVNSMQGQASNTLDASGKLQSYAVIGTDLTNDHPISIPIVGNSQELTIPPPDSPVQLENGLIQCASCHDPHSSTPLFQRMEFDGGVLCLQCHLQDGWNLNSAHRTATDKYWTDPEGVTKSVANWGCFACHEMMGANSEYLLQVPEGKDPYAVEEVCFKCHGSDGSGNQIIPGVPDITGQFYKAYSHPVQNSSQIHWPKESNPPSEKHVECEDCHDPHYGQAGNRQLGNDEAGAMLAGIKAPQVGPGSYPADTPWTPPNYGAVQEINYEYELCLKCHGTASNMDLTNDHMEEIDVYFNPNNLATHGCIVPGENRNPYVVSGFREELGWDMTTTIACSDCHGNDDTSADRIRGPHGSMENWLLRKSGFQDGNGNDVVCYLCHDVDVYGKWGTQGSRSAFPSHTKGGHWWPRAEYPPGIPPVGCFICHGDFSGKEQRPMGGYTPGGLHGANSGRADRPETTRGTHFLNGLGVEIFSSETELITPGATISCGDYLSADGWGCDRHATESYTRPNY